MNERENLIRVIKRDDPHHVPFHFNLSLSLRREFMQRTGQTDYEAYYNMPVRGVFIKPTRNINDFSQYFDDLPPNAYINEWGIGNIPGETQHFVRMIHPMERLDTTREIEDYPMPDILAEYRWSDVGETINKIKREGYATLTGIHPQEHEEACYIDTFERAWYLRGMFNLFNDLYFRPEIAEVLLDKINAYNIKLGKKWAQTGIDIIVFGDDVGTQRSMMMSPDIWRKWLKPRLKMVIQEVKKINPEVAIYYHSDGNILDIIPDLIETGVEVINPVQPECMDPIEIKRNYGEKLSFWGTLGTQTTMPFGTAEDVAAKCSELIDMVGKGGGLVLAPTHILEPEVPWENIDQFVETVLKYGVY
jgi:uroporphyrinogen decarboxylase